MNDSQATPIWLEMRTEYIDANFDKFVEYLYNNRNQQSETFYQTSLNLLRQRVRELTAALAGQPLSDLDNGWTAPEDKEQTIFHVRLLGAYLLSEDPAHIDLMRRAFDFQLLLLTRLCPEQKMEELTDRAVSVMVRGSNFSIGYGWSDIRTNFMPEVLATKILEMAQVQADSTATRWFEGTGCARIADQKLQLMNIAQQGDLRDLQPSLSLCNDLLEVLSASKEKLKQSQQGDFPALASFVKKYLEKMQPVDLHLGQRKLKKYYPDPDTPVDVKIIKKTFNSLTAVTTDPDHESLQGTVKMDNILYCKLTDLVKAWEIGDEMPVRINKINNDGTAVFDATPDVMNYVLNNYISTGCRTTGIANKVVNGNTLWFTDLGLPVYTQHQNYPQGTVADLTVTEISPNGYIKVTLDNTLQQAGPNLEEAKKRFLHDCCYTEKSETPSDAAPQAIDRMDPADLKLVAQCLYLQQRLTTEPAERYRMLCAIRILSHMTGDTPSDHFAFFLTQYLENVVLFAQDKTKEMYAPTPDDAIADNRAVQRRMKTLEILRCYDRDDADDTLAQATESDDESERGLARLIQSCNGLKDILSNPMRNAIKHEILTKLKVDDDTQTDLEEEGGIYLGTENGHQEFKTSFVYPPENNMQPDPEKQKKNIFRAICAFMNSESGGVIYLGVNDLGGVCGVDNDMKYLKLKTLDAYMRFLTDQIKAEFRLGLTSFVDIQSMYDDRVVALNVKPCDYKVVEVDGKAYIRVNAENREMTRSVRLRLEEKKRTYDKGKAESLLRLQTAMGHQKQVIVHGYSSSHSGNQRDRHLEPFSFTKGQTHVWCYDLDDQKVKIFSVSRMGNVEVTEKPWTATDKHKEGYIDIFHMTGDNPEQISLTLDRMAYNLLVEEYPDAKQDLTANGDDTWTLTTRICSILGLGRFYLGLADHITILHAPTLQSYAQSYFAQHSGK